MAASDTPGQACGCYTDEDHKIEHLCQKHWDEMCRCPKCGKQFDDPVLRVMHEVDDEHPKPGQASAAFAEALADPPAPNDRLKHAAAVVFASANRSEATTATAHRNEAAVVPPVDALEALKYARAQIAAFDVNHPALNRIDAVLRASTET